MQTHEESYTQSPLKGLSLVENWLNMVAISHSDSKGTRERYKAYLQLFCNFIGKTSEQIVKDYEEKTSITDREVMRRYAQLIQAFASAQYAKECAPCTISSRVATIRSFFKYSDLPLGYVTVPRMRVVYHNRDITHEEIRLILNASKPRERAYYTIMAQSGLRPETICNLRLKHIKEDLANSRIPCKIEIPEEIAKGKYHSYFTFIGEEAVKYLKAYLNTGPHLNNEDFLFVKEGTKDQTNPKSLSNMFRRTVQKLKTKGLIETEQKKKNRPRNIRLYNLRKFFRKHAHQAGFELVQFWMGHTVSAGQDDHYRPTDVEFHRKVYAEKAMPFLRLETATPTETEKTITELKKQIEQKDHKLQEIEKRLTKIEPLLDFVSDHPHFEALLKDLEEGRYAKIESEHSMMVAQYPKRGFEELMKRAEAEGKEYIEFTPDQLRKMSLKKEHQRETTKTKNNQKNTTTDETNTRARKHYQ